MHEPSHDEQVLRLQRIAYGAVASDAERADALAELESLRRAEAGGADVAAASVVDGPEPAEAADDLEASAGDAREDAHGVSHRAAHGVAARPLTWAIAAGTAALLVGVAVGWQAGARTPAAEPVTDPASGAPVSLSVDSLLAAPVPVDGSAAYAVFDRPATPQDMPPIDLPDEWRISASPRLLATMPNGMTVYAAKPPGESVDLCVLTVVPDQPGFGMSCTHDETFEGGVLSYEFWHDRDGTVTVAVHADGSVQITVPTP
ncbi:hypothetical protein [Agromyces sp. H66]|uniref:hypothetical protein n=1 Tax=Agromyces sp. H66 TaxID=2529859 RepID=UPI0010A999C3|nr:hypothetical protein [Agromyces sp. H66]